MDSSDDPARALGAFLTATEAREIASRLLDEDSLTVSLRVVASGRRTEARALLSAIGSVEAQVAVLRAVEGARSAPTTTDPLWTMPGHLAQHGRLTQSVTYLVDNARYSVVCSTFNFQRSSGLWRSLSGAARRSEITLKVYMDKAAADSSRQNGGSPSTSEVAEHLHPGLVFRTRRFDGKQVRNHSKFISIDHRFLLVTSANFSWSAENANLEFGVLIDNPNLAEAVEQEMRAAEDHVFERVDVAESSQRTSGLSSC